jgi:hypothetical protein
MSDIARATCRSQPTTVAGVGRKALPLLDVHSSNSITRNGAPPS